MALQVAMKTMQRMVNRRILVTIEKKTFKCIISFNCIKLQRNKTKGKDTRLTSKTFYADL